VGSVSRYGFQRAVIPNKCPGSPSRGGGRRGGEHLDEIAPASEVVQVVRRRREGRDVWRKKTHEGDKGRRGERLSRRATWPAKRITARRRRISPPLSLIYFIIRLTNTPRKKERERERVRERVKERREGREGESRGTRSIAGSAAAARKGHTARSRDHAAHLWKFRETPLRQNEVFAAAGILKRPQTVAVKGIRARLRIFIFVSLSFSLFLSFSLSCLVVFSAGRRSPLEISGKRFSDAFPLPRVFVRGLAVIVTLSRAHAIAIAVMTRGAIVCDNLYDVFINATSVMGIAVRCATCTIPLSLSYVKRLSQALALRSKRENRVRWTKMD